MIDAGLLIVNNGDVDAQRACINVHHRGRCDVAGPLELRGSWPRSKWGHSLYVIRSERIDAVDMLFYLVLPMVTWKCFNKCPTTRNFPLLLLLVVVVVSCIYMEVVAVVVVAVFVAVFVVAVVVLASVCHC